MKAISLWQPWASAVSVGSKRIETRHWSTNHRGPICFPPEPIKHRGFQGFRFTEDLWK